MAKWFWPAAMMAVLAGCNGGPNQTNIELVQNMMDQPIIKSQSPGMRLPPEHALPRGYAPYPYADDPAGAERQVNPLSGNMSPEVLAVGRKNYDIYCGICHGDKGAGDGRVAAAMNLQPRNLLSADARNYTDGRIFHAITAGRGLMGAYISQIPDPAVRWKIVNYVRSLQR